MRDCSIDSCRIPVRLAVWVVALAALSFSGLVYAVDATVSWTHPTAYEDDSPLPVAEIASTIVEWARCTQQGTFPTQAEGTASAAGPATSLVVPGLPANALMCFRAATVVADQQSVWSDTATGIWLRRPRPPRLSGPSSQSGEMTVVVQ